MNSNKEAGTQSVPASLFPFFLLGSNRQDIMIAQLVELSKVREANLPHRLRCSVAWFDAQGTQACEGARTKPPNRVVFVLAPLFVFDTNTLLSLS